jgi:hypothetical protein
VSLILRFMGRPKLGRSGVNDADYHVPFRFTGTINKLTVKPGPEQFTEDPPIRAPTVYPGPAKAARRPTQRCLSASGNGMAGSFGSTRRSIRASVSRASTGGRISERTGLQVGRGLSVRARTALFRPADDRSRRRNAEGGARHQSIRRLADEESLGAPVPPTGRLPIEVRCT